MESVRQAKRREPRRAAGTRGRRFEAHVAGFDYDVLDRMIGFGLVRAKLAIYEDVTAVTGAGVTAAQFSALVIIGANSGLKQTDLSRILAIAPSGVVALLDGLVRQGWVQRRTVRSDRRANGIQLTPKGKVRTAEFKQRMMEYDRRISHALSEGERAQLIGLLARLG